MLPHVQSQDGSMSQERVLILGLNDVQVTIGVSQPSPTGSLDGSSRSRELGLELVEATKVSVDGLLQGTVLQLSTTFADGSQVLPEEGVVDVTTTVELDGLLGGNLRLDVLVLDSSSVGLFGGVCERKRTRGELMKDPSADCF